MVRLKVACVMGTRPEVIKFAPVVRELRARGHAFEAFVITTAQHRDMLDQMLVFFKIRVDVDLDLMEPDQTPARAAAKALEALDAVYRDLQPDVVLVQGDTITTMAASLGAFLRRIPIGHIEAGLRSFDRYHPFPEEIARRFVSMVGDWHFAPTEGARANLLREGVREDRIHVTGNTVIDALLASVDDGAALDPPELNAIDFIRRKVILVTAHRRENHGAGLSEICSALEQLVIRNSDVEVVLPVHPNPNVQATVRQMLSGHPKIHLVPPLAYPTIVNLMNRCYLIMTDSGGIQEEAPSLHKPVLVLRDVTERPEAMLAGLSRLVGTRAKTIVREAERLLRDQAAYHTMTNGISPYGDGKAAVRIVDILEQVTIREFGHPASRSSGTHPITV